MTENEILILNFVSNIMSQIWSYYSGFVFFGVPLTAILSAMLAVSIILPFLYQFTSGAASTILGYELGYVKSSTIKHESKLKEQKRDAQAAARDAQAAAWRDEIRSRWK